MVATRAVTPEPGHLHRTDRDQGRRHSVRTRTIRAATVPPRSARSVPLAEHVFPRSPFNLHLVRADGACMGDAAAGRLLASDHNLEFVDLDRYNVDTSAARLLPVAVARRHHVVPIGRKFGAPVVAIADPTDIIALDTLRATMGREFVAVVAPDDQIEACLERVYRTETPLGDRRARSLTDDSNGGATSAVNGVSASPATGPGRPTTSPRWPAPVETPPVAEFEPVPAPAGVGDPVRHRLRSPRRPRLSGPERPADPAASPDPTPSPPATPGRGGTGGERARGRRPRRDDPLPPAGPSSGRRRAGRSGHHARGPPRARPHRTGGGPHPHRPRAWSTSPT